MYKLKINEREYESEKKIILGKEILELAEFSPVESFDLNIKIQGKEYEPIQYDEVVDLSNPGIEKFLVKIRKTIKFLVDDEEYTTEKIDLTPIEIFNIIGLDSSQFYLKQIIGHKEVSYKNDEDVSIRMLGKLKFITCKREPTTVS